MDGGAAEGVAVAFDGVEAGLEEFLLGVMGSFPKMVAAASVNAPPKPSMVWKVLLSSMMMAGTCSSGCSRGAKAWKPQSASNWAGVVSVAGAVT